MHPGHGRHGPRGPFGAALTPASAPRQVLGHVSWHLWLMHPRGFPDLAQPGGGEGPDPFGGSFLALRLVLDPRREVLSQREEDTALLLSLPSAKTRLNFAARPSPWRHGRQEQAREPLQDPSSLTSWCAVMSNALSLGTETVHVVGSPVCKCNTWGGGHGLPVTPVGWSPRVGVGARTSRDHTVTMTADPKQINATRESRFWGEGSGRR